MKSTLRSFLPVLTSVVGALRRLLEAGSSQLERACSSVESCVASTASGALPARNSVLVIRPTSYIGILPLPPLLFSGSFGRLLAAALRSRATSPPRPVLVAGDDPWANVPRRIRRAPWRLRRLRGRSTRYTRGSRERRRRRVRRSDPRGHSWATVKASASRRSRGRTSPLRRRARRFRSRRRRRAWEGDDDGKRASRSSSVAVAVT